MKYYAVKRGKKTGIFTSWDECKESVLGYPNADYKSFKDEVSAQSWLNDTDYKSLVGTHIFYTLKGDTCTVPIVKRTYRGSCTLDAELQAVCGTVKELAEQGHKDIIVHYKGQGVLCWYDYSWTPKAEFSIEYSSRIHDLEHRFGLNLTFIKEG